MLQEACVCALYKLNVLLSLIWNGFLASTIEREKARDFIRKCKMHKWTMALFGHCLSLLGIIRVDNWSVRYSKLGPRDGETIIGFYSTMDSVIYQTAVSSEKEFPSAFSFPLLLLYSSVFGPFCVARNLHIEGFALFHRLPRKRDRVIFTMQTDRKFLERKHSTNPYGCSLSFMNA